MVSIQDPWILGPGLHYPPFFTREVSRLLRNVACVFLFLLYLLASILNYFVLRSVIVLFKKKMYMTIQCETLFTNSLNPLLVLGQIHIGCNCLWKLIRFRSKKPFSCDVCVCELTLQVLTFSLPSRDQIAQFL